MLRDLYDFWYVMQCIKDIDINLIVDIFERYIQNENMTVSRAEFERNLSLKRESSVFNSDITPLLSVDQRNKYSIDEAYQIIFENILTRFKGDPWKGMKT